MFVMVKKYTKREFNLVKFRDMHTGSTCKEKDNGPPMMLRFVLLMPLICYTC